MNIPSWLKNLASPTERLTSEEVSALVLKHEELEQEAERLRFALEDEECERVRVTEWLEKMIRIFDKDVPSITEQTKWRTGFFDFGKATEDGNVRFFNCGLIRRDDGLWLITRRSHNVFSKGVKPIQVGMNDVVAFNLGNNLTPTHGVKIRFPTTLKEQHHEDPRVCQMGNNLFVSATTFQVNSNRTGWTGAHQCVARVNQDWRVDYLSDPIYGKNGGSPMMNTGNEKNWLWFEHDRKPHLVYMTDPHTVVQFDKELIRAEMEYITNLKNPMWQFGQPRGGTPPVRVGDEYFTFFHSSTPWTTKKNRYHMGAVAFKAEPPFPITRMTSMPILSGSKNDEWHEGLPLVVFPCGAVLEDGKWLVTMGVNDCCSAWIEIPHDELLPIMRRTDDYVKPVQKEETNTLTENHVGGSAAVVGGFASQSGGSGRDGSLAEAPSDAAGAGHAEERVPRKKRARRSRFGHSEAPREDRGLV